jgi:large subunit ribosomal protein L30
MSRKSFSKNIPAGPAKKVRVTLTRSLIGVQEKLVRVANSLGLRKTNQSKEHFVTPITAGMLDKVIHLITVEELS